MSNTETLDKSQCEAMKIKDAVVRLNRSVATVYRWISRHNWHTEYDKDNETVVYIPVSFLNKNQVKTQESHPVSQQDSTVSQAILAVTQAKDETIEVLTAENHRLLKRISDIEAQLTASQNDLRSRTEALIKVRNDEKQRESKDPWWKLW